MLKKMESEEYMNRKQQEAEKKERLVYSSLSSGGHTIKPSHIEK